MRALFAMVSLVFALLAAVPWLPSFGGQAPGVSDRDPGAAAADMVALPPLAQLTETTARPLFAPSRRPQAERVQAFAPVVAPLGPRQSAEQSFASYRLQGVVITREQRKILLGPPGGGRALVLEEGQSHDGWTVEKIEQEQITLRAGERREVLPLRRIAR